MRQDKGATADADRAVVNGAGQAVSALRASVPSATDRDSVLMEVAGWVEEGDLIAWAGIGHRRKRVREDAALRVETSEAVRARLADMIRGRMENKVGDPARFLREVKNGEHDRYVTGWTLREAIALADRGLLKVCVVTQIAGPWNNVVNGVTGYQITITDKGEKFLAQAIEARRAETQSGSVHESAVAESDAPPLPQGGHHEP